MYKDVMSIVKMILFSPEKLKLGLGLGLSVRGECSPHENVVHCQV